MAKGVIRADIAYDFAKNKAVQKYIRELPGKFTAALERRLKAEVVQPLKRQLQTEPRPAVLPFTFATAKSRRWYFANKVKGKKGGRYVRTHKFTRGWDVRVITADNAVALSINNPEKATKYITGKRQVPGHRITGWRRHDSVYNPFIKLARKSAVKAVKDILAARKSV